jgi:glycyl-tRNA synthetase beta chain
LHGIVALLGEEIVPVEVDGISSGASTVGHRFHHPGPITIGGAADYIEKLRACHVIVDQDERERIIREGTKAATDEVGLSLLPDEGLVVENAGLTEWPVPLIGSFEAEFLDVPREVIVLTMRTNQKYFACANDEGLLAPVFVCVANVAAKDGGEAIVEGNRKVLAARLADARFFWEQDLKIPLEEQAQKLDGIVFHEKLGTVADKVERVAKLARWLVESGVIKADADQAERAARLAKADLVTGMVGEFPELQGVIGGYLAEAQGEPQAVADAVRDHYKPAGQGDEVPTAPLSVAVALADKLDSLFAFFREEMFPTGSKDPFALRRAAIGAISLILENKLRVHTDAPAEFWLGQSDPTKTLTDADRATRSILTTVPDFLLDRLQVQQRDKGIRHDLISASARWASREDGRLDRIVERATALQEFIGTDDGADLLTGYKRAANILKKENWEGTSASGGSDLEPREKELVSALDGAEPKASAAIGAEDFTGAMAALASLRRPIDEFFDHVTVNDPDAAKRERRLNLLMRFRDAVNRVADFSRIEG